MFTKDELSNVVAKVVPPDRTNAVVGVVDKTGASIVVKMTKGDHWEIDAAYRRDWGGNQDIGAQVIYSW